MNRLTFLKESKDRLNYNFYKCECGRIKLIYKHNVNQGKTKSCGCYSKEITRERCTTHGKTGTKVYISWVSMLSRCCNEKNKSYKDYGGRGIKVCEEWLKFENFLEDMGELPFKGAQLDRIYNDGNYSPSNCKWSTRREQTNNTRRNKIIRYKNKIKTLPEWSDILGIPSDILRTRLFRKWSIVRAFETPYIPLKITTKSKVQAKSNTYNHQ